jgi:hypothetical protein
VLWDIHIMPRNPIEQPPRAESSDTPSTEHHCEIDCMHWLEPGMTAVDALHWFPYLGPIELEDQGS